ncbi:hypothetical protein ASZ90_014622 [hydrocarbon metagenome]|uniref:HEAT repeat domain-containing protein n=1 Tax=hydrocarbon metagenome TaxID=938273 RepID=A0A0W8F468_9ZZZZ
MHGEGMIPEGSHAVMLYELHTTEEIYRLIGRIDTTSPHQERIDAMAALGDSRDPRAVRPLITCCSDENSEIRRHAIRALYAMKSGRAVAALTERLKDKNEARTSRKEAAKALAAIRSHGAIAGLVDITLDTGEEPDIRIFAATMLGRMGKG